MLLLAAMTAALLLAMLVGTASAGRIGLNERGFRAVWSSMRFAYELDGDDPHDFIACPVTLEGSFHSSTFAKTREALLGVITRAGVGTCEFGSLTVLTATLPWHIKYQSFTGVLPNISAIRVSLVNVSWQTTIEGLTCLARSTVSEPTFMMMTVTAGTGRVGFTIDDTLSIPATGLLCERLYFSGNTGVTRAGSSTESLIARLAP
jgi:hypothetical protein